MTASAKLAQLEKLGPGGKISQRLKLRRLLDAETLTELEEACRIALKHAEQRDMEEDRILASALRMEFLKGWAGVDDASLLALGKALNETEQEAIRGSAPQKVRHSNRKAKSNTSRPPFNAEYLLYLLLRREERDTVIGDLVEEYAQIRKRFGGRRASVWFYKEVAFSIWPFFRRAVVRIGTFVWLGRLLQQLIS
jgi:hypothetical protein